MAWLDNFIAGWEFNEASGSTIAEVAGVTGYNGTSTGSSVVAGFQGNARNFASTSTYFTCPSGVWSGMGGSTTVISYAFRIKFNTVQQCQIMRNDGQNGNCGYMIGLNSAGKIETFQNCTGNYAFPGGYLIGTGTTTMSTGVWYHIVMTWDGTYTKVYVNGTLEINFNANSQSGGYSTVYLGVGGTGFYAGFWGYNQQSFNSITIADIDCWYIWKRTLTSTEASDFYNNGLVYPFGSTFMPAPNRRLFQAIHRASNY